MDINDVQLVGGPCGQHGPYTFYKAFKYSKNGIKKIITLSEFFFVKMWRDSDLLCIGELQLLWTDKNSEQTLASLRLYFLPENTPEGRMDQGEDELLAISEKVVIRMDDLITWITVDTAWSWGRLAKCEEELKEIKVEPDQLAYPRKPAGNNFALSEITMDFSDIEQERDKFENPPQVESHVIVLSFPKYCRYRSMMKRLEGVEDQYLKYTVVNALGGFYVKHPNTRILFCRDTFDYPELEGHELLCNHLAPKLKGRPRGKRKKRSISPGSESNESESSITNQFSRNERSNGASPTNSTVATRRSTRCHENNENKQFMKNLASFMKAKHLPMGRVPSLGYKELNLHEFYTRVQKLGGYECVTTNRLWKSIFDDMTGHLNSTSAATIIRRHYERFLLAYERHEKGEEDKPLPTLERRRLKSRQSATGSSDSESGPDTPSTSRSSTSPPVGIENKEVTSPGKTSSLRSVRVKLERQKDKIGDKTNTNFQTVSELVVTDQTDNSSFIVKSEPAEESKPIVDSTLEKRVYIDEKLDVKLEVKMEAETAVEETVVAVKDEDKPKNEPYEINPSIPEGTKTEGSIPAEPITNAVAPIATTVVPEHNLSPLEAKENIPVVKTADVATVDTSPQINSYTASLPEIVKADREECKSEDESAIRDVKKIKLEILKEGGLEVTPVTSGPTANSITEFRPSVIQPPTNNFVKPVMAPPSSISNVLPKRNFASSLPSSTNVTHMKRPSTPVKQAKPETYQFLNGATPPKVVQSKSIYSYSEKMVYGNPKDDIQPSMLSHTPKSMVSNLRPSDPVDLSLTSPQKPQVEILPAPHHFGVRARSPGLSYNRASVTKNLYRTNPPLLGGRKLGPNLEITLVGPKQPSLQTIPRQPTSHKRPGSETYAQKIAKLKSEELNSRYSKYNIPHVHKSSVDIPVPSPFGKSSVSVNASKSDFRHAHSGQKTVVPALPQAMPPYLPSRFAVPENSNGINPYLPIMDSLYYQAALQNVYSNFNMPPLLPIPSPEQLKFYADLMAHGRLNMPFAHSADGHPSMSNNNNNIRKP